MGTFSFNGSKRSSSEHFPSERLQVHIAKVSGVLVSVEIALLTYSCAMEIIPLSVWILME